MGKAKPSKKITNPGGGADFKVNPFADLKSMINVTPSPATSGTQPPPTSSPTPISQEQRLSQADQELLKAFGDVADIEIKSCGKVIKKLPKVSFRKEKKGHGGKTVIVVSGLSNLNLEEQMNLCKLLKKGLGTGAYFEDDRLFIQGDQEQRVADWFEKHKEW